MVKKSFSLVLLLQVLLVAGCTNVDIKHFINSDGSSSVEVIIDYEPTLEIIRESGGDSEEFSIQDVCGSLDFNHYGLMNAECNIVSEYQLVIRGDYPAGSLDLTEADEILAYRVKSFYPLLGFIAIPSSVSMQFSLGEEEPAHAETEVPILNDEYLEETSQIREMIYLHHTYEVVLPGGIISSDVGQITGNSVLIDMFSLPQTGEPVILASSATGTEPPVQEDEAATSYDSAEQDTEAEETDIVILIMYGLIGLVGVSAIGFLAYFLLKKKEEPPEKKPGDPDNYLYKKTQAPMDNYTVNKLVEWIHVHEKKFPDDVLKDVLRNHGHTEDYIEEAFRRR